MQTSERYHSLNILERKPLCKCPDLKSLKLSPVKVIISENAFTMQIWRNTNAIAHMPFLAGVLRVKSEKDASKLLEFFLKQVSVLPHKGKLLHKR